MAEIVLFHHAQGLTPGVLAVAEAWKAAGHKVHTPDLYNGHTFETLEEGIGYAKSLGFESILDRGVEEGEALGTGLVYAGISLGVMPAQKLAQTREGARGALLTSACLPVSEFGDKWPDDVPVQVHGMEGDSMFADEGDLDAARELVAAVQQAQLFLYPGTGHLFVDRSLADYDKAAADLMERRVLDFLSTIG
jgi:dienelactone hydrolase